MKKFLFLIVLISFLMSCENKQESEARILLQKFEDAYYSLEKEYNLASFNSMVTGEDKYFRQSAEYQMKMDSVLSDTILFAEVKKLNDSKHIKDEELKRQLLVLHNLMASKQIKKQKLDELTLAQNKLEQKFSTFRATIDNKKVSDNVIDSILKTSTNNDLLKEAWLSSKEIGDSVATDIIKIVKLRNSIARDLGYPDFYKMNLILSEEDPKEIEALFDELDKLTEVAYTKAKDEIDGFLSAKLSIGKNELRPWHYQNKFFQEAPAIYNVDLDKYYSGKDVLELVKTYYEGINLEVKDIIKRSDLFEKEGKNQHAFCTHIDRNGDIRILANIRSDQYWAGTMLHELGHGVYEEYLDADLPLILREPAHSFTTEAIANMFGRLASNATWMQINLNLSDDEYDKINMEVKKSLRLQQLVFSRWSQVMYRFEKNMYENPDQDLNKLWWDLVEKYQLVQRPDTIRADWASKIHLALYPCYYHNYLMGELLASQLQAYIYSGVLLDTDTGLSDDMAIGDFLVKNIFEPAKLYPWNIMIEEATGEKLSARYFAEEFLETEEE